MTVADITLAVFTLFNSLRFLAYVPQIAKALKDKSGAEAISFGTWALFLISHLSAMAYAIVNQSDWAMAILFLSNAVGCAVIIAIAGWKRSRHRRPQSVAVAADGIAVAFAEYPCGPRNGVSRYDRGGLRHARESAMRHHQQEHAPYDRLSCGPAEVHRSTGV